MKRRPRDEDIGFAADGSVWREVGTKDYYTLTYFENGEWKATIKGAVQAVIKGLGSDNITKSTFESDDLEDAEAEVKEVILRGKLRCEDSGNTIEGRPINKFENEQVVILKWSGKYDEKWRLITEGVKGGLHKLGKEKEKNADRKADYMKKEERPSGSKAKRRGRSLSPYSKFHDGYAGERALNDRRDKSLTRVEKKADGGGVFRGRGVFMHKEVVGNDCHEYSKPAREVLMTDVSMSKKEVEQKFEDLEIEEIIDRVQQCSENEPAKILGLENHITIGKKLVEKTHKMLMLKLHPDKCKDERANDLAAKVSAAHHMGQIDFQRPNHPVGSRVRVPALL